MLALGRGRWAVSQKPQLIHFKKTVISFVCLLPVCSLPSSIADSVPGGDTPRISCGGVPTGSSNPDPISDHKIHFSHPFSDLAS